MLRIRNLFFSLVNLAQFGSLFLPGMTPERLQVVDVCYHANSAGSDVLWEDYWAGKYTGVACYGPLY